MEIDVQEKNALLRLHKVNADIANTKLGIGSAFLAVLLSGVVAFVTFSLIGGIAVGMKANEDWWVPIDLVAFLCIWGGGVFLLLKRASRAAHRREGQLRQQLSIAAQEMASTLPIWVSPVGGPETPLNSQRFKDVLPKSKRVPGRKDNYDKLLSDLKSVNPLERRSAAADLGSHGDRRAISPLFKALMNWDEDEETVKAISVALFIQLWIMLPQEPKELLRDTLAGGQTDSFCAGVRGAVDGLLMSEVLAGERPNPGQTGRISLMMRNALPERQVRDVVAFGEEALNWSKETRNKKGGSGP